MANDLSVNLGGGPGTLAQLGEVLGNAGINIEGVSGQETGGVGRVHILVAVGGAARQALSDAGIECGPDREVEVVSIVDVPGEMGRHLRRIADAGVDLDLVYLATNTRLVLGADDPEALRKALHEG